MDKLNPAALAECGDDDLDDRPDVQSVTEEMIFEYIRERNALPPASALAFSAWLWEEWNNFVEDDWVTNGAVINGALIDWRGGA